MHECHTLPPFDIFNVNSVLSIYMQGFIVV